MTPQAQDWRATLYEYCQYSVTGTKLERYQSQKPLSRIKTLAACRKIAPARLSAGPSTETFP